MSNRFERLIIGSAHEGAEGMFEAQAEETSFDPVELEINRQERGILPDAQERFERTLAERGLEQVQELPNGMQYPTLDKWVEHRINYERGTKFFPSFIKNKDGETFFCKAQLTSNPDSLKGLEREAERLQNLPSGVRAPKLIEYLPPQENHSALLITEAISMREATVTPAEYWSADHARDAVQQIKSMEDTAVEKSDDAIDFVGNTREFMRRAGETVGPEVKIKLNEIIAAYESHARPAFVHGDATLKNILMSTQENDDCTYFVDWEFEGNGFLGQDAAKLWTGLRKNPEASQAFLESYVRNTDGSINEERKKAITFGVAAENLVHLAWRNESIIMPGKQDSFPQVGQEISENNQRILEILQGVDSIT
jgi:aminoglycoside phosphotransferase